MGCGTFSRQDSRRRHLKWNTCKLCLGYRTKLYTKEERFKHETQECSSAAENLAYGAAMEEEEKKNARTGAPAKRKGRRGGKLEKSTGVKEKTRKGKGKSGKKEMPERNKRILLGEEEGKIGKAKKDGKMEKEGKAGKAGKVAKAAKAGSGKAAKAK